MSRRATVYQRLFATELYDNDDRSKFAVGLKLPRSLPINADHLWRGARSVPDATLFQRAWSRAGRPRRCPKLDKVLDYEVLARAPVESQKRVV